MGNLVTKEAEPEITSDLEVAAVNVELCSFVRVCDEPCARSIPVQVPRRRFKWIAVQLLRGRVRGCE
jgi:hypothetical protein